VFATVNTTTGGISGREVCIMQNCDRSETIRLGVASMGVVIALSLATLTACQSANSDDGATGASPSTNMPVASAPASTPSVAPSTAPAKPQAIALPDGAWDVFNGALVSRGNNGAAVKDLGLALFFGDTIRILDENFSPVELSATKLFPGWDIKDAYSSVVDVNGEPMVAFALNIMMPSQGLDPAHLAIKVVVVDRSGRTVSSTDLPYAGGPCGGIRAIGVGSSSVFSLTVNESDRKTCVSDEESDPWATIAMDAATGQIVWTLPEFLYPGTRDVLVSLTAHAKGYTCQAFTGIDLATSDTIWTVSANNGDIDCASPDEWYSFESIFGEAPAHETAGGYLYFSNDYHGLAKAIRGLSGATAVYSEYTSEYDPISGLAFAYFKGNGGSYPPEAPHVYSPDTGKDFFHMTTEDAASLDLQPQGFYNSVLYLHTSDEYLLIDAITGEHLGTYSPNSIPLKPYGDMVLFSDNTLRAPSEGTHTAP
jgi:hypothetical protein